MGQQSISMIENEINEIYEQNEISKYSEYDFNGITNDNTAFDIVGAPCMSPLQNSSKYIKNIKRKSNKRPSRIFKNFFSKNDSSDVIKTDTLSEFESESNSFNTNQSSSKMSGSSKNKKRFSIKKIISKKLIKLNRVQ